MQEFMEMQAFQEGHTPGIWIWINTCISLSHCPLLIFYLQKQKVSQNWHKYCYKQADLTFEQVITYLVGTEG